MIDPTSGKKRARIFYARVDEFARREEKYQFLDDAGSIGGVEWQELHPDAKHTWLTEGMRGEFESFLPMGTKEAKASKSVDVESIFGTYSTGIKSGRDAVVYDFDKSVLLRRVEQLCESYNAEVARYVQKGRPSDIDAFVKYDSIKWSRNLKQHLKRGALAKFDATKVCASLYRPFAKTFLYFDKVLVDETGLLNQFFQNHQKQTRNNAIWLRVGTEVPMFALTTDVVPDLLPQGGSQCFPLYTYDEDGANRRDNITDWALAQFRAQYADRSISKLDIFHYVYALLHHPTYRTTYAANLKRELPRVPFVREAADFRRFVSAGARLAELHVNYEAQEPYKLDRVENPEADLSWRVERMRLSKDKRAIVYNDFLTLEGIPPEAFEYRLGNRSALEWIIDQYQVTTDKRSGITNDPNRADEPDYIVKLIGRVTTVSVETVRTVRDLPALSIAEQSEGDDPR